MALFLLLAGLAFADSAFSTVTLTDGQTITGLVTVLADGSVTVVVGGGSVVMLPASVVRSVRPAEGATITAPLPVRVAPPVPVPPPEAPEPVEEAPESTEAPATEPEEPAPVPDAPESTPSVAPPVAVAAPLPLPGEGGVSPHGWPSDPNRVGYFYSPSAFTLGAGRGYVSQKELAITAAAFGITDFWDIQVGTVLPLLFTESRVGIVGTKVAFKIAPGVRFGGGVQVFFVAADAGLIPFVVATVGDEDRHLSVNLGYASALGVGAPTIGLVTVSGDYRLGARSALVTENWILIYDQFASGFFAVPTAGVRLFGPEFAVDLGAGVLATSNAVIPLPWVGFTWNWGLPGKGVPEVD